MRTVGEILSEQRKKLNLNLEQIEKETKIRIKFLQAIEKNDFSLFSEIATARGFIRNFALSVGLSPENLLAVFRRDFVENKKGQIILRSESEDSQSSFRWTPKATFFLTTSLLVFTFGFFFLRQYWRFSSAPSIEILSPKENQVFQGKVEVIGKTEKDATVKVDGSLIDVSESGDFKEEVVMPKGENIVTVEAANRQGRKRTVSIKVKVE